MDINPNSCEITKLRLWIELLKYSYYIFEEGKNTNALETLPNIDINIKCANSLISRFNLNDDLKKIPNIKKKIQEYKDLVAQYKDPNPLYPLNKQDLINKIQDLKNTFSITLKDPKTKAELEKAIEKHIKKYNFFALDDKSLLDGLDYFIPSLFGTLKLSPKEEEEAFASYGRIRALRKKLDDALSGREYQNAFEWRFEFPEVLNDEGDFLGFDCIMGNPPYIDYRKIDEKTKIFLSKFSSVYKKSKEGSIFVYFIERASKLIIKHGLISFINPIAYLCKPTDHGIRDYIDKNLKITMLIDLSNIKIFESASTYTCINIFKRENKKNEILFLRSDDLNELSSNKDDFLKIPDVNIEHISIFLDPISRHIAERFKTQLGGFCKIFCGLSKTGFRSDVINTNSEKSVYFLESSDIYRYYVNDFGKKFLKRIDDYFSQEKQEIFEQQDIIFMTRMTNQIRCVVVPLGVYGGKVNILHDFRIDRFLILGVLNSKLMTYFYKKKFFPTHMQGGAFGFDTLSVETLPFPQITTKNQELARKITDCAKQILALKAKDPKANTQGLEKEIDALVYQLYNLTDEEIKIIENGQ
ncbi:Eco57I restriction-modification methylase domain-containing protein [Helicobacter pylori]|uniref:Eco57I restriction-modification methylase domain-containing protein n=1 Tax=Helicobacter pylori TaxID=210 RepID=UPI0035C6CA10